MTKREPWPWPAPVDDNGCDHLVAGFVVPEVTLPGSSGEMVDLAKLFGLSVVFVYPYTGRPGLADPPGWDDIAGAHGSTPQAEGFRDQYKAFSRLGARVFGLSGQGQEHQRELVERLGLPFSMLSDVAGDLQKAMKLPMFQAGDQLYFKRVTLVIDDGRVTKSFYPVHPPDTNACEVLNWFEERLR